MAKKRTRRKSSRRRRRNPSARVRVGGRRKTRRRTHRVSVYKVGRGKRAKLYRSRKARLMPRRVNRRRRRRNPSFAIKKYFGGSKIVNAVSLLFGIGASAGVKAMLSGMVPMSMANIFHRGYGVLSIIAGTTISNRSRRSAAMQRVGTGFVAFGIYDLLVTNIPMLGAYLPQIGSPAFLSMRSASSDESVGAINYGRSVYGSAIGPGAVEVVGASISEGVAPEIVGAYDDYDLADALEMSV